MHILAMEPSWHFMKKTGCLRCQSMSTVAGLKVVTLSRVRQATVEDRAGGEARNLPVPEGLNDTEFNYLIDNCRIATN